MRAKQSLRRRGVTLTPQGQYKLAIARRQAEQQENEGRRFTLEELCDRTQLSLKTITKALDAKKSVDRQTLVILFAAFDLVLEDGDYGQPKEKALPDIPTGSSERSTVDLFALDSPIKPDAGTITAWGEAPDVAGFYGRQHELSQLQQWVQGDRCRLISVLGRGGMGKTTLVTRLAHQLAVSEADTVQTDESEGSPQSPFQFILWSSLRNAPSLETLLSDWLAVLSRQRENKPDLARLLHYLKTQRCLLLLDNLETILDSSRPGMYQPGYEGYGELLRLVGATVHQSCLILTSREKVLELAPLEEDSQPVRCLMLQGCLEAAQQIIQSRGLVGTAEHQQSLCDLYSSSPLAIQIIAATIRDLFEGDIGTFLEQDAVLFNGLRRLLDQQFERLLPLEQTMMFWLAINRHWTTLDELQRDLLLPVTRQQLLEAIESLHWRSLIEKQPGCYSQQPVVMEYVTERLTEQMSAEILAMKPQTPLPPALFLSSYALLKSTAKDYIRVTQSRLLLEPVCNLLQTTLLSRRAVVDHLKAVLAQYWSAVSICSEGTRDITTAEVDPSYAAGNVLNLLHHLGADLSGIDVSGLAVWQAYLPNVPLPHSNFAWADLQRSQLTDTFGAIFAAIFSPDGDYFVTGELGGYLRCWQIADGQPIWTVKVGNTRIHSLAIRADGKLLAVGSSDRTIELFYAATGHPWRSLSGHDDQIYCVAFHPAAPILASASGDGTLRLWDSETGDCLHCLEASFTKGQSYQTAVCFSPDGNSLVSGGSDRTLKLWDWATHTLKQTLVGHEDQVFSVGIHPQGQILASGSADGTVKLWNLPQGSMRQTFNSHTSHVFNVRFSPDGTLVASSGGDATICLWETATGHPVDTLRAHNHWIRALAFSPNGDTLLSGGSDYTLKLWDAGTWQVLRTWSGYSNWIWSTDWSPNGTQLLSGGDDRTVRLWDLSTGQCRQTLRGHTSWVLAIAFGPDGQLLASAGGDNQIILWNARTGQVIKTLMGHTGQIFCLQFSPTESLLVSSSSDYSVRLWEIPSGQLQKVLQGHQDWIRSVSFSPDGKLLASASLDLTVKLWDVQTGACLRTWHDFKTWSWSVSFHPDGERIVTAAGSQLALWDIHDGALIRTFPGHTRRVRSVAMSPDGRWLASGGQDMVIYLWDVETGEVVHSLSGHADQAMSVKFSPDNRYLASGSADGTLIIWELSAGRVWKTLKPEGLYEGMEIIGISGLSEAALSTLQQLGAMITDDALPVRGAGH